MKGDGPRALICLKNQNFRTACNYRLYYLFVLGERTTGRLDCFVFVVVGGNIYFSAMQKVAIPLFVEGKTQVASRPQPIFPTRELRRQFARPRAARA